MAGGSDLAISEITELMRKNQEIVAEIIKLAVQEISPRRSCGCRDALEDAAFQ
jgi:lambda repressor-like predicted transcriptional regulator